MRLLQNSIRAFQNGFGQRRDVCSFEDIGQSQIIADVREISKTVRRDVTFILNVLSESSINFDQFSIVLA